MRSLIGFAAVVLFISSCASLSGGRKPADVVDKPPLAKTLDTWVYTWTGNPAALSNPAGYVAGEIQYAGQCLDKIGASANLVTACEGNERAAGPGLYTCDNPFTSHDYGSVLVAIRTRSGRDSVGLATGRFTPPPASNGLDRSIYADKGYSGLLYDFRLSDFNSRALVVRGAYVVNVSASFALPLHPSQYAVFGKHEAFECTPSTDLKDIFQHWGDQFEFLAMAFDFFMDPDSNGFLKGADLDRAGYAAAIASDTTAAPDAVLAQRIQALKAKFPEIKDSMTDDACAETETTTGGSPRACLARRVFDSLTGNIGSPNHPTYSWSLRTLRQALVMLKVASPADVNASTSDALLTKMSASYKSVAPKVLMAYQCMMAVRAQAKPGNFALWGEDPP